MLNPHIFREFSIRGLAESDLHDEAVGRIGCAAGAFFRSRGIETVVVGRDVRHSSPRISRTLIDGLRRAGMHVLDIGQVPTPVHNFATDHLGTGAGVMVTASHNPSEYNGLKLRTGVTLHGDDLQAIFRLASETACEGGEGKVEAADVLPAYTQALLARAEVHSSLTVVVDAGNGSNGPVAPGLLRALGCRVRELYCRPDGAFPNRDPDPTAEGATDPLAKVVRGEKGDLGIAYDGDGDRMIVVDEEGERLLGDELLMLLARDALRTGSEKIVYEVLCSQAVADDIRAHGGEPIPVPSGYAFVHQAMLETGAALGGELSGHFFFRDPDFRFDDALLATVKLLSLLSAQPQPLSALRAELPRYHASPEFRLPCPDAHKAHVVERVKAVYRGRYPIDELDGARVAFGDGWALVRQSNTQPVISMRFEALTTQALARIQEEALALVEKAIGEVNQ